MLLNIRRALPRSHKQQGFTLIELSIVLIVIGLIIGAVSVGKDLQRNASYQAMNTVFIQGWRTAYETYFERVGIVVGDDAAAPTLLVNEGAGELCGQNLVQEMQLAGITTPSGRAPGSESLYVYLDSNGNPQQTEVCFNNVDWSVPNGAGGFLTRARNVMVIKELTPDLARYIDAQVDSRTDARYGVIREDTQAANVAAPSIDWSTNNLTNFAGTVRATSFDEDQIAVVIAVYQMSY